MKTEICKNESPFFHCQNAAVRPKNFLAEIRLLQICDNSDAIVRGSRFYCLIKLLCAIGKHKYEFNRRAALK